MTNFRSTGKPNLSRRSLVSGALLAGVPSAVRAQQPGGPARSGSTPTWMYVGTYSSPEGPEGSHGRGDGIYLFQMTPSGALKRIAVFENPSNPSCLAVNPDRTFMYTANETQHFQGKPAGSVSAYSIRRADGHLTLLNTVSSEGAGPAYLSVHPSGKFVLVANYHGGSFAVLPVKADGALGAAVDTKQDRGKVGAEHARSAPVGSFAISGHDRTHGHMIQADPSGRFVLGTDLGTDEILVWKFDASRGTLTPNDPASVRVPSGDGPRHFAFHPNGRWFYSIQEEGSTLMLFDYDAQRGVLTERQTISTLPKGFAGTNFTSEVAVSADGRFVYAANRLHDTIAVFSIGANGTLTYVSEAWTRGDYPRSFTIDPSGRFLYSCNQRSDAVTTFRVNQKTGELTFTGEYTPVGTPSHIVFLV